MKIQEVMSGRVDVIVPTTTVKDAATPMRGQDVDALPVGEDDRLVGMITDGDIAVRGVAEDRDPENANVRDIMSESIHYCFEDEEPDRAADVMAEHQVRRLPILNRDKRLFGMDSLADLVTAGVADRALRGVSEGSPQPRQ